jgi:drug/metabolite transporter (DMT)-like permease
MSRRPLAHIALFTVNFIYGVNYVVAKGLMPQVIQPAAFILLRVVGAGLLFWIVRSVYPQRVAPADLKRLFLCALFGVAINQLMFFEGLMRTSPIDSSIIMVATPILVLVMSSILIGERITWRKIFGVVLGAAGAVALILLSTTGATTGSSWLGDLFILINATSYAVFLVIVKPLMSRYSAITVMSWCFLFGLLLVTPFGIADLFTVEWTSLTPTVYFALGFVVVMVTFVAYLLNTWALRILEPGIVGMYIYLQPLLAVVVTWLFMQIGAERIGLPGEYDATLGLPQLVCALMIFTGVYIVSSGGRRVEQV